MYQIKIVAKSITYHILVMIFLNKLSVFILNIVLITDNLCIFGDCEVVNISAHFADRTAYFFKFFGKVYVSQHKASTESIFTDNFYRFGDIYFLHKYIVCKGIVTDFNHTVRNGDFLYILTGRIMNKLCLILVVKIAVLVNREIIIAFVNSIAFKFQICIQRTFYIAYIRRNIDASDFAVISKKCHCADPYKAIGKSNLFKAGTICKC